MTIEPIIKSVQKYVDEVLVILSPKNTDRTSNIAQRFGCIVYTDTGKGKGAALRIGIEKATKDILVFIDADGSHDPHDIPKLLNLIFTDKADFVVGSRALGGSEEFHTTFSEFARNVGGALIMLYINYLFKVKYTDCENGLRAIKTDIIRGLHLTANDFDIEQEMVLKALKRKVRLMEVPTHEYKRKYGRSRLYLWKTGWKFIWRLIVESFRK